MLRILDNDTTFSTEHALPRETRGSILGFRLLCMSIVLGSAMLFGLFFVEFFHGPRETPGEILSAPHWHYDWSLQVNAEHEYRLLYINKYLPIRWWAQFDSSTVYPSKDDAFMAIVHEETRLEKIARRNTWAPVKKLEQ